MSVQVTSGQYACLFYFPWPAARASLLQGQQTYLPLRMFDNVTLDQRMCLKQSSYVCNSFKKLAGMLLCLYNVHTTSMHVCYSFICSGSMYITFAPDHQPCLLQWHLAISHVFNSSHICELVHTSTHAWYTCTGPAFIFVIAISDHLCCLLQLQQTRVAMVVTIA